MQLVGETPNFHHVDWHVFTTPHIPSIMPLVTTRLCYAGIWEPQVANCEKSPLIVQQMIPSRRTVDKRSIILSLAFYKVLTLCLPTAQRAHFARERPYHCKTAIIAELHIYLIYRFNLIAILFAKNFTGNTCFINLQVN